VENTISGVLFKGGNILGKLYHILRCALRKTGKPPADRLKWSEILALSPQHPSQPQLKSQQKSHMLSGPKMPSKPMQVFPANVNHQLLPPSQSQGNVVISPQWQTPQGHVNTAHSVQQPKQPPWPQQAQSSGSVSGQNSMQTQWPSLRGISHSSQQYMQPSWSSKQDHGLAPQPHQLSNPPQWMPQSVKPQSQPQHLHGSATVPTQPSQQKQTPVALQNSYPQHFQKQSNTSHSALQGNVPPHKQYTAQSLWNMPQVQGNVYTTNKQSMLPQSTGFSGNVPKSHNQSVCCFFCGEDGHVTTSCRHGKSLECNMCGLLGHKAKHHH
jgi:hypothetical protein